MRSRRIRDPSLRLAEIRRQIGIRGGGTPHRTSQAGRKEISVSPPPPSIHPAARPPAWQSLAIPTPLFKMSSQEEEGGDSRERRGEGREPSRPTPLSSCRVRIRARAGRVKRKGVQVLEMRWSPLHPFPSLQPKRLYQRGKCDDARRADGDGGGSCRHFLNALSPF